MGPVWSRSAGFVVAVAAIAAPALCAIIRQGAGNRPHPRFVYRAQGVIEQFRVTSSGHLVPLTPPTVEVPGGTTAVAVAPNGRFAYAVEISYQGVAQFRIRKDGSLARLVPFEVSAHSHRRRSRFTPADGMCTYRARTARSASFGSARTEP